MKEKEEFKIEEMTLEQKIGQLIVVRNYKSEEEKEYILEMVKKGCVGGIQMWNNEEYEAFVKEARELADYPILICADMETGYLGGEVRYPYPIGISSSNNPELAYELARATAIEAKKDGVNVVWGPVLDITKEGALCKISRCFGDEPETISKYAIEMIKGFQDEGMIVTAKHFPGGSDIISDPHMKMEASSLTEEELINNDIVPYLNAMKEANLSGIMTGHVLFENIDSEYIASLSEKIINLIRSKGFDGIIMTDSLAMMAIVQNYGEKECLGLAINAGNDMVLPNYRLSFKESYEYLMEAYKNGMFTEERLNDAVRHVTEAQRKTLKSSSSEFISEKLRKTVENANKESICAVVKENCELKLLKDSKKLFVLLCENSYPGITSKSCELVDRHLYTYEKVLEKKDELLKEFPDSEVIIISEFPHYVESELVCRKISRCDEAIFFCFCHTSSYLGSDGITDRIKNLIQANAHKVSTVVHIGNPYEIKKYKGIKKIITASYGAKCDKHIIDILKGNFVPCGKISIDIS